MLSSGLRSVNMVCRCCWMSPCGGIKTQLWSVSTKRVTRPNGRFLPADPSPHLHVCCGAARSERQTRGRSHFLEVKREQLLWLSGNFHWCWREGGKRRENREPLNSSPDNKAHYNWVQLKYLFFKIKEPSKNAKHHAVSSSKLLRFSAFLRLMCRWTLSFAKTSNTKT